MWILSSLQLYSWRMWSRCGYVMNEILWIMTRSILSLWICSNLHYWERHEVQPTKGSKTFRGSVWLEGNVNAQKFVITEKGIPKWRKAKYKKGVPLTSKGPLEPEPFEPSNSPTSSTKWKCCLSSPHGFPYKWFTYMKYRIINCHKWNPNNFLDKRK